MGRKETMMLMIFVWTLNDLITGVMLGALGLVALVLWLVDRRK